MMWTPSDAVRRWIVVIGLIAGPALLVLSVAINLSPGGGSMRNQFDAMSSRSGLIVAEALLETLGFMIVLASFAGATLALRVRGGALGTWGAVLAIIGIVGFSFSNANGFTLAELAQLPDRDAAFTTAAAITSSDTASFVGTLGMAMEVLGQVGILLIIGGLVRARLVRFWLLLVVVIAMVGNIAIGTMLSTLVADLLLLGVGTWVAVRLARASRSAWLGEEATQSVERARASV